MTNRYDGTTNNENPAAPTTEEASVHITKAWLGGGGKALTSDAELPANLMVTLAGGQDGEEIITLTKESGWTASLSKLAKYDTRGELIAYSVTEQVPDGYNLVQTSVVEEDTHRFSLTNTKAAAEEADHVQISVSSRWLDAEGQAIADHTRLPASLNITLTGSDGSIHPYQLLPQMNWEGSFTLPRTDDSGKPITYTLSQSEPGGYRLLGISGSQTEGFILVNQYDGRDEQGELTSVTVTKVWQSADGLDIADRYALPGGLAIRLIGSDGSVHDHRMMPSGSGVWVHTFDKLYKVDTRGLPISYTVRETAPADYPLAWMSGDQQSGFVLTNRQRGAVQAEPDHAIRFNLGDTVE